MNTDYFLKPSADQKTRFRPGQKNTFGLLPGPEGSCPGATTGTGGCWYRAPGRKTHTCYVDNLMNFRPAIRQLLTHNLEILKAAETVEGMTAVLDREFTRFHDAEIRHQRSTGDRTPLWYRIHWSGDFFNLDYARAVNAAIQRHPGINFWGYTRVFDAIPILKDLKNLTLYISLDPVNCDRGLLAYEDNLGPKNKKLRYCYMSPSNNFHEHQKFLAPVLAGRNQVREIMGTRRQDISWLTKAELRVCPVDTGKMALESGCRLCGRCTAAEKAPVWFES